MRWMIIFLLGLPVVTSAQFTTIQLPTTDIIRDIECRDSICIASDNRESVFFSADHFNSNRSLTLPVLEGEYKTKFRYWDDSTYFALLNSGGSSLFRSRLIVSLDYGETWSVLWDDLGAMNDFSVLNDSTIILVGLGGRVFYSTNSGAVWINESQGNNPVFVVEADHDSVIIIGELARTYTTTSFFNSFFGASIHTNLIGRSIAFTENGNVFLASSLNQGCCAVIYKSLNYGDTWQKKTPFLDNYNIWQLAFQDSLIGYASGKYIPQDTGMVFTTIDGGETWNTSVRVPTNRQLLSIAVANDTTVLIGATGGKLFRWNPKQWTTDLASASPPFSLSLQPNPASATQQLSIRSDQYGQATISIYDIHGRPIEYIPSSIIMPGEQTISVDISSWPAGIYVYRVEMNGEYVTLKGQKV